MLLRIAISCFLILLSQVVCAADHAVALRDYLADDVAAVAYADLSQVDLQAIVDWCDGFGMIPEDAKNQLQKNLPKVQQKFDLYKQQGITCVYALFRASDLGHEGVTWVVPVAEGGDERAVMGLILSGSPNKFHVERDMRPPFLPDVCEIVDGYVLGARNQQQLEMLKNKRPRNARDLSEVWKALGQGHCGLVVFGDSDSRRVVRELFPELPPPFEEIDGPLIADGLQWGGFALKLPPEPELDVLVETSTEEVAQTLDAAIRNLLMLARFTPLPDLPFSQQLKDEVTKQLEPRVDGNRVRVSLHDVAMIAKLAAPPLQQARESARRQSRMNKLKQIVLGSLNYESAKGSYPPRASFSEDGQALLSWRVHILPYLGQQEGELYQKFKLDQPWDSEHNRTLQTQMPPVYFDPDSALARINQAGRTTFVLPNSPETIARGREPATIREVTDGTSNTILAVEVPPENAVIWTRPDDWQVNLSQPWQGLLRDDRNWFTAAFCDGSVQILDEEHFSDEKLRALLTIAGGEVIKR